eukprot:Phypoly_transcript_09722.p1 GENE.Phypoly_transcript_09722~~Phypoly_transcript_09722.p1  ORF type:complete len:411 (+),score=94.84 Phypoly_transcript_09722:142-1374(+)
MQARRDPAIWEITPPEKAKYEDLFRRVGGETQGFISGPQFSAMSQLALGDAGHIFKVSDFDKDLKLNKREFAVAMFLTDRKKEGHQISNPPPTLIASSETLFPSSNNPAPFNPSYNPNLPSSNPLYPNPNAPTYNPNVPNYNSSTNPSYNPSTNPNVSSYNPSTNPNVPSYNPNVPSYNPNVSDFNISANAPPLSRTVSQPLPQASSSSDLSRVLIEKDNTIANLQAQLAQANDARIHAEDARKHAEDLLLQANIRLTQQEVNAHRAPSSPTASAPYAGSPANVRASWGYPAQAVPSSAFPTETLNALEAAVNASTSAQDMEALCARLKAVHARAKQRMGELQQIAQQRKIDELESSLTCPICMDQKKNVSCVPCGHALCRACADAVSTRGNPRCPICREEVRSTNPIYL